jgi:sortase (surface protein transpeptidase)
MKKVFILLLLFIVACGGPNEETVVQDTTITSIEDTTTTTVEDTTTTTVEDTTTTTVEETTTTTIPMTPVIQFTDDTELKTPFVELGTLIGILEIDILGVETLIYEGTSLEYLQTGVGHYQATELHFGLNLIPILQ